MRGFLADSACNGCRPKNLGPARLHSRPRLMKKLMSERGVARFLVAPAGFGKTSLALEYADSIFGFRGVFWLNCQSPCFLRDLDRGIIASTLSSLGEKGSLTVFEDVPYLDDERAQMLSDAIDALLGADWEVLVTTTPVFDALAERQTDRVCVGARDFLVDDVELEAAGLASACVDVAEANRVAAFVWGGEGDMEAFLRGMRSGEMPAELQLAVFVMLVLQAGSLDELLTFMRSMKKDMRRFLSEHYPYVGLDLVEEKFLAHDVPMDRVIRTFGGTMETLARGAAASDGDALVIRLADALAAKRSFRRACELMEAACSRKKRMAWVEKHQDAFLDGGCVFGMQSVFESAGASLSRLGPHMLIGAATRLYLLDEFAGATSLCIRAMASPECSPAQMCEAAVLCDACGLPDGRKRAWIVLEQAAMRLESIERDVGAGRRARAEAVPFLVAAACFAAENDYARSARAFALCAEDVAPSRAGMIQLALLLRGAKNGRFAGQGQAQARAGVESLMETARRALDACAASSRIVCLAEALVRDAFASLAGEACCDEVRARQSDTLMLLLARQRRTWADRHRRRAPARNASRKGPSEPSDRVPEMYVRLFGGMQISIGGRVLDPSAFRKQRAKTLLAVLVLHRGKEVPRTELLNIMWPSSAESRSTNNFYSLWSVLRKALSNEAGECPYLVRHQASCMVDARYVRSDVDEFETLCRRLFFEQPDPLAWLEVFGRLQDDFSCALLPSETDNAFIVTSRERFRARLVDAYVTAANRLCDAREPQVALWFAQAALELARGREDVYLALMKAQVMAGQRTLAMETYFACSKHMKQELGVDPCEQIMKLYEELLEEGAGQ